MVQDRPLLLVSLAVVSAFALVFAAAMAGTAFMLTGGFGGHTTHAAATSLPTRQFAAVTSRAPTADETIAAPRPRLRVTKAGGAELEEADYAADANIWVDDLAGEPSPASDFAYGQDGRLYQDVSHRADELRHESDANVSAAYETPSPW
jgi:hypothetical protein